MRLLEVAVHSEHSIAECHHVMLWSVFGLAILESLGVEHQLADAMSESEHVQTVDVEANRESPTRTTVETRSFELVVDEPEAQGGTNTGPSPLEYLLAAQAGCLNVTGH